MTRDQIIRALRWWGAEYLDDGCDLSAYSIMGLCVKITRGDRHPGEAYEAHLNPGEAPVYAVHAILRAEDCWVVIQSLASGEGDLYSDKGLVRWRTPDGRRWINQDAHWFNRCPHGLWFDLGAVRPDVGVDMLEGFC